LGENAKAAILRQGLEEMRTFAKTMFPTVRDETFFESCGVADLIATCYGGRNHMVAEEFAKCGGAITFEDLERDLLNGQKLQGVLTSMEVQTVLERNGWEKQYPLFTAVNAIIQGLYGPKDIVRYRQVAASNAVKGRLSNRALRSSLLEDTMGV
jgi:glycerol-3-phosphate dehydrogenase (NAD+)